MDAAYLKRKHQAGLAWDEYLSADPEHASGWREVHDLAALTDAQGRLIAGFPLDMKVLCLSGIWCGDCRQQGPLIQRIAEASPRIDLRWLERDDHDDLAGRVAINAGRRVPVVIFMAEDYELVSVYGDRGVTRYRALAAQQLGEASPPLGAPAPEDPQAATLADWLDEFERVQLLLRLSTRLRKAHGD